MSKNDIDNNNIFVQDSNTSVIVENRALSPEDLLCDDGNHPDSKGVCADGSHPIVIRANPVPVTTATEEFVNETNTETSKIISLCANSTIVNSTTGKCDGGLLPLQVGIEDLICTNGNNPVPNGTCADGSLPRVPNKTQGVGAGSSQ